MASQRRERSPVRSGSGRAWSPAGSRRPLRSVRKKLVTEDGHSMNGINRVVTSFAMKLFVGLLMVSCAAMAQTPDLKSASGYPKMVQKQVTAWIEQAAAKMPEEEYAFKPDPAVRTFGQILGHIADANYLFCSGVLGEKSPSPGIEKTKTTKAEL